MDTMWVVVVMSLTGTVEAVVGPFWYEDIAAAFATQVGSRYGKRASIKRIREREEWKAEQDAH